MNANVDPALLEMFAAEVETHMAVLNDGLLALEQNPDQSSRFEALMRASHSIKGAAKLVGIPAAVDVAHVIEDSFVSAREGRLAMTSGLVDVLLAGVDLLGRAAQVDGSQPEVTAAEVAAGVQRILQVSSDAPAAKPAAARAASPASQGLTLRPPGLLDAAWVETIRPQVGAWCVQGTGDLELNLTQVADIDPAGLALIALAAHAQLPARRLRLKDAAPRIDRLLQAVGLATPASTAVKG